MLHNSVNDFVQGCYDYILAAIKVRMEGTSTEQWSVPLDAQHRAGITCNRNDDSVIITVCRRTLNNEDSKYSMMGENLLRNSFETRLGAGLIGGIMPLAGICLSWPLFGASDENSLRAAVNTMLQKLRRAENPSDSECQSLPFVTDDARHMAGDTGRAECDLSRLAQSCGLAVLPHGIRHFELLFDDLPIRIMLHPSNRLLIIDFFLHDAMNLRGNMRRAFINTALLINQTTLRGNVFVIGLDSRNFVTATCRIALSRMDDDFWPVWLKYQMKRALEIRVLIKKLSVWKE